MVEIQLLGLLILLNKLGDTLLIHHGLTEIVFAMISFLCDHYFGHLSVRCLHRLSVFTKCLFLCHDSVVLLDFLMNRMLLQHRIVFFELDTVCGIPSVFHGYIT